MQRVAGREHLNGTTDGDFGVAAQRRLLQTKARCDAAKSAVVRALGEKKPLSFPPLLPVFGAPAMALPVPRPLESSDTSMMPGEHLSVSWPDLRALKHHHRRCF